MIFAPAFLAFLGIALSAGSNSPSAGYAVTLPSDDANFVFRFPGKPADSFAEAQWTTDQEYGVATRFSYQARAYSFSVTLLNFHRDRTARQSSILYQGALDSLNGKRPNRHLRLEDLGVVSLGGWKGRELRELTGNSAQQISIFALPHGVLAILSRWNVDDPVAVNAMKQFSTPTIENLISSAPQSRAPPEIEYFYESIRPALAVAYRMLGRTEQCVTLFASKCTLPPDLATGGIARAQQLLHLLTHAGFERMAPLSKPEILEQVMAEFPGMRPWFNEELLEAEKRLFARVAAVFEACPGERSAVILRNLPVFEEVNFTRFWEQSRDVYDRTSASIARQTTEIEKEIESGWTSERCAATYNVARSLVGGLIKKTRPFAASDWEKIPRSERFSSAVSFVWDLTYMLEHHIDPGIDDRLDAPAR